ncbi:LOW QUALITY PROTEIN: hypothetical protein LguiA_027480 [Lonicera macranthoides]
MSISSPNDNHSIFTLPNWRSTNIDPRTRSNRLNDAFFYFEHMARAPKPDVNHATQLMFDLYKRKQLPKASRVMEMMVSYGIITDAKTFNLLLNELGKRGDVGEAMQLFEQMEGFGYTTYTATYNSLVRGLCVHRRWNQCFQFLDKFIRGLVPNAHTCAILVEAAYKERGENEAIRLLDGIVDRLNRSSGPVL